MLRSARQLVTAASWATRQHKLASPSLLCGHRPCGPAWGAPAPALPQRDEGSSTHRRTVVSMATPEFTNPFVTIVCPLLGNLLSVVMLMSPLPAVWGVRKSAAVKNLNPLPYPFTLLNCIGWLAYGISTRDMWIVPANLLGVCGGLYFTLSVFPHLTRKTQDGFSALLVVAALYFGILGVVGAVALDAGQRSAMWGAQSVVVLMLYYAIPLSSMWDVIKTRNAASIYPPLAIAAFLNGGMWAVYGMLAVSDYNIWIPNSVGALLALLQIGLRVTYGAREDSAPLVMPNQPNSSTLSTPQASGAVTTGHQELTVYTTESTNGSNPVTVGSTQITNSKTSNM